MKIKIKKVLSTKRIPKKDGSGDFPISQVLTEDDQVFDIFGEPKEGEEKEGEVVENQYGKQFKEKKSGGSYRGGGRSSGERTEIIRQNALGHAIRTFEISKTPIEKEKVVALAEFYKNYVIDGIKPIVKPVAKPTKEELDEQDVDDILEGFDEGFNEEEA